VEDAPLLGGDEDVLALPDLALGQVARDEHVGEREGVGTRDLDLLFDADVPERDAVEQLPVFLDRVPVEPGMVRVVIHAVQQGLGMARGVVERGLTYPGIQQDARSARSGRCPGRDSRVCLNHTTSPY